MSHNLEKAIVAHELEKQERPGLVKKTITVRRKGKVFRQVRYVRPDIAPAGKPKAKQPVKLSAGAKMFKLLIPENELRAIKMLLPARLGKREGAEDRLGTLMAHICTKRAFRKTPAVYADIKEAAESVE